MITAGLPIGVIIAFSPLELSCTSKQAPGCTYSQHNAHDCADCEIKSAGIDQNLKCVTHYRSSGAVGIASRCGQPPCTSPSRALSDSRRNGAATFIDSLPSCTKGLRSLVSSRRAQPFLGAQNLFPSEIGAPAECAAGLGAPQIDIPGETAIGPMLVFCPADMA